MTALLEAPVRTSDWQHEAGQRNGNGAPLDQRHRELKTVEDAGPWEPAVQAILAMQHLGDDWDGLGAKAPSRELLESAIGLAFLSLERGTPPPDRVVPGLDGVVIFEWQPADGTYTEVEIDRPFHAEVMVIEPGRPARQWTLPTE